MNSVLTSRSGIKMRSSEVPFLIRMTAVAASLFWGVSTAWGWGAGHLDQSQQVVRLLPEEVLRQVPDDWPARMISYRSYQDTFEPFCPDLLGADALEALEGWGIRNVRYVLHNPEGTAAAFILLVEMLKEERWEAAAVWAGSLIHSIGDATACNHEPMTSMVIYAFGSNEYGVVNLEGLSWDLPSDLSALRGEAGDALLAEAEASFTGLEEPPLPLDDPDQLLVEILMLGARMSDQKVYHTGRIIEATDAGKREEALQALADLSTVGSHTIAAVLTAAFQLAERQVTLDFTDRHREAFAQQRADYYQPGPKPLSSEYIFASLVASQTEEGVATGFLLEPSYRMNEAMFGFGAKYLQAIMMRELKQAGLPYRALDGRRVLLGEEVLDPAEVPVLVVCWPGGAGTVGSFRGWELDPILQEYVNRGGRLLWVGGASRSPLGKLHQVMLQAETAADGWPVPREKFAAGQVRLLLALMASEQRLSFTSNPHTRAGWHRPHSDRCLDPAAAGIVSLAEYRGEGMTYTVAGALADENDGYRAVFLPAYLVSPYLLTEERVLPSLARPGMDTVARAVFLNSLSLLEAPGMKKEAK